MTDYLAEAQKLDLVAWRRDLHRHPELGFAEVRTAGIVARHLSELGLQMLTGIGKTGVVGLLKGTSPLFKGTGGTEGGPPVVMLRFDMDALPIMEENVTDYVSQTPGVMHACGHDGHVAIGLGVATLLARHRNELSGSVKFVFQPAEEGMGGAMEMIKDGALQNPRPNLALGLHIINQLPLGQVGVLSLHRHRARRSRCDAAPDRGCGRRRRADCDGITDRRQPQREPRRAGRRERGQPACGICLQHYRRAS
jgi:amidohydrolase